MQPDNNPSDWRQPNEQPAQAPYSAPPAPARPAYAPRPAVTLAPQAAPVVASWRGTTADEASNVPPNGETEPNPSVEDVKPAVEPVRWQAYEYIQRNKNRTWYILFGLVCVILIAVAIFVIQSFTFAVLIPVMAAALIVYSRRPPRLLDYTLSQQGLHINDQLYSFVNFKGFAVIHGDDEYSVLLIPIKRFKPGVSVYFPEEAGEAIVDMLASRLPMQELHLDLVDRIIRKLRI